MIGTGAQGGDWGSPISRDFGLVGRDHVVGVHLNNLFSPPPSDPEELAKLTVEERARLDRRVKFVAKRRSPRRIQSTTAAALAHCLAGSPPGQWPSVRLKDKR